jgi:plastocyanin
MPRRIAVVLATVAGLCLVSVAPAAAAKRVVIRGGEIFKAGHYVKDNQRFTPRNTTVRSGEKVTVRDRSTASSPHTLSIVRKRDLPDSFQCAVCEQLFVAHEANEETGDVGKPLVNVGDDGFDQPGDSIFVPPGGKVSFRVTADEGTNLNYLCAIHPWMQGKFKVR